MARPIGEEKRRNMVSSTGYCYSDGNNPNIQTHLVSQLQNFASNPEIYNLSTGMELIGFPPKSSDTNWFFGKIGSGGPTSSKATDETTSTTDFYHQHEFSIKPDFTISDTNRVNERMIYGINDGEDHGTSQNLMVSPTTWHENRLVVDDPSLRCVFPCEANERPSQGLSLSLSSNNPSSIGLQSFELRQPEDMRFVPSSSSRDGFFGKSTNVHQQMMLEDGFMGKAANLHYQGQFQIRNSKYLVPAQEILNEFCNLGTKQSDHHQQLKLQKTNQWQDRENASSSSKNKSLYSLELLELQKRKTKLLQMLEQVDRRYNHYCDQMKAVVSSFEGVAGDGAATVYSALASQAMSRYFRCLRDGIVGQIKATKTVMGERDTAGASPGSTRGQTPRLRLLDQTLRQERAFQQMNMMESHPWRPQRGLPERSVSVLRAWLFEHFLHPYPSDVDKHILARQTGLSRSQVSNWFINARVRLWKPMVEEMYLEETKEQDNINMGSPDGITAVDHNSSSRQNRNPPQTHHEDDQKPTPDQLIRIDSECLSSIINNPEKNECKNSKRSLQNEQPHDLHHHQQQHSFGRIADSFGAVELDFSSYNHHSAGAVTYANENAHQNFGGGGGGRGGGVSLTLGLQQHGGSGVSLAFSPTSQNSLFFPRDHIEDCQPVQYSLLDGEGQNLPYRNLMGAQLLPDLAG